LKIKKIDELFGIKPRVIGWLLSLLVVVESTVSDPDNESQFDDSFPDRGVIPVNPAIGGVLLFRFRNRFRLCCR